jgi:hypothetical protein
VTAFLAFIVFAEASCKRTQESHPLQVGYDKRTAHLTPQGHVHI